MRIVGIGILLLMLPLLVAWLQAARANRDIAVMLLGVLVFLIGRLDVSVGIVVWNWTGTSPGITLGTADIVALALLLTRERSGRLLPFTWLMASLLAVLALSVTYSFYRMPSLFSVWDFCRVFLVFLAVGGEIARPSAFRALLRGLSIGLMVQAGFVIEQKLSGVIQATGTGSHQNGLGMMTEIVVLLLVGGILEGERDRLFLPGVVAGLIVVAGGGSRAAIALLGIAILLLIAVSLVRNRTAHKVAVAAGAAALLTVSAPVAVFTLKERFGERSVLEGENVRPALEKAARLMSRDHPLGVGANLFQFVNNTQGYAARSNLTWHGSNRAVPVHNAYLLARTQVGYHGEAIFALLLLVPMVAGFRHAFRYRRLPAEGWTLGAAMALAAIAVHSVVEFGAMTHTVQVPLVISIAVIAARMRAVRETRATGNTGHPAAGQAANAPGTAIPQMPRIPPIPGIAQQAPRTDGLGLATNRGREARS